MCEESRETRRLRERHRTMLWVSVAVLVLACLLRTQGEERVSLIGLARYPLPEMCGSRTWFGWECPGCGLTRSFIALGRGDLSGSLARHRIGWLMALAVCLQIPYRLYALRELNTGAKRRNWPRWCSHLLIAALMLNWLWNVAQCQFR
jgi:hypothetical protein